MRVNYRTHRSYRSHEFLVSRYELVVLGFFLGL